MSSTYLRPRTVLVAASAFVMASACSGSSAASCAELREQLATLDAPKAAAAWDDIVELQDDVGRALELRRTIAERCGEGE